MASQSSGSATGNPRNKVSLKPGHSLMDWIRLGNSGRDLSGTNGAILEVTSKQLAEHRSSNDAWLCIRGNVYNVSQYMDFHPGGIDELMKGAGKDATNLFNSVHPWVNYESLLKKCLVGKLVLPVDNDIFSSPKVNSIPQTNSSIPTTTQGQTTDHQVISKSNSVETKTDWYQQKEYVTIVVYREDPTAEVVVDGREEGEVWIGVGQGERIGWTIHSISWPPSINITGSKLEVKFIKSEASLWPSLPRLDPSPNPSPSIDIKIVSIFKINYNVYLIKFSIVDKIVYHVPIGYHLLCSATIKGILVERNYTPIELLEKRGGDLHILVKCYPDGIMSSWLCARKPGDILHISRPLGTFKPPVSISENGTLLLLAAGSGITPMIRLVNWAVEDIPKINIKLIFFNKSERDIIMEQEFNQFSSKHEKFNIIHVLSEGSAEWKGRRGWVTLQLVQSFIPDYNPDEPNMYYTCVCGPVSFTQLNERYLQDLGYSSENYFCFRG